MKFSPGNSRLNQSVEYRSTGGRSARKFYSTLDKGRNNSLNGSAYGLANNSTMLEKEMKELEKIKFRQKKEVE